LGRGLREVAVSENPGEADFAGRALMRDDSEICVALRDVTHRYGKTVAVKNPFLLLGATACGDASLTASSNFPREGEDRRTRPVQKQ
jgi:hypothetical protein